MNWFYTSNGNQKGPIPQEQLITLIRTGEVKGTDLVWKVGMNDWTPSSRVAELNTNSSPAPATLDDFAMPSPSIAPSSSTPVNYGAPAPAPYQQAQHGVKTSGLAIASLICGVLGLVTCCTIIFPVLAIILGIAAKSSIAKDQQRLTGNGLATGGMIMGVIGLIIGIFYLISFAKNKDEFMRQINQAMEQAQKAQQNNQVR